MPYRNLKLACAEDSLSCWEGKCHISRRFKEENFNGSNRLKMWTVIETGSPKTLPLFYGPRLQTWAADYPYGPPPWATLK